MRLIPSLFIIDRGLTTLRAGSLGGAAFYFTMALASDWGHHDARRKLVELAPDISLAVMPRDSTGGAHPRRPPQASSRAAKTRSGDESRRGIHA